MGFGYDCTCYTYLGGLSSAIYNEVLQFFIIIIGLLPLVFLSLKDVGGWSGLKEGLAPVAIDGGYAPDTITTWKYTAEASQNPLGVEWFGILFGLGFVLSFGYWCTNFLIVQRAFAAESLSAARKVPLIGALPKMFIPFLIIVPGIIALVLMNDPGKGFALPLDSAGKPVYDYTIIMLLKQYLPAGVSWPWHYCPARIFYVRYGRVTFLHLILSGLMISIRAI